MFHFHIPLSGRVDPESAVIKGVAVITGGVTAKGHNLEVDEKTVDQIISCGKAAGKVQVKYNHKSGVEAIGGYLTNFRREGEKGVADWYLLKTHEETAKTLEKAQAMPGCFGLSASFAGPEKGERIGKKNYARCTELVSVDCVPNPAANPTGLFSAKEHETVDNTGRNQMPKETAPVQEPTMAEVMEAINGLKTHVDSRFQEIEGRFESQEPLTAEELEAALKLSDDEIAAQFDGATREQVQATLDHVLANADTETETETEPAPASTEAVAALAREFRGKIHDLASKIGATTEQQEQAEVLQQFEVIEQKYDALVELCEQKDLQIASLQRIVRSTPGRAASPGAESVRMFSTNEDGTERTEFETLCSAKVVELSAKDPKAGPNTIKAQALRLVKKENPRAFSEHQAARGIVELAD